jgi:probable HAF family extracellular repeat protein
MVVRQIINLIVLCLAARCLSQPVFGVRAIRVNDHFVQAMSLGPGGVVSGGGYSQGSNTYAFRWSAGAGEVLSGFSDGGSTAAFAVNVFGAVAGEAGNQQSTFDDAALWDSSGFHDLGRLGGATALGRAINRDGWVVGDSDIGGGQSRPFLYRNGSMQSLGSLGIPGAVYGTARQVSDSGLVTGADYTGGETPHYYGWYWTDGTGMVAMPIPGGGDLNEAGDITYGSQIYNIWSQQFRTLPDAMFIRYINNNGWAIGESSTGAESLWIGQSRYDLATLMQPGSGYSIDYLIDVNDSGQILAMGLRNSLNESILLTPVPEPTTLVALVPATLGALVQRRRRK